MQSNTSTAESRNQSIGEESEKAAVRAEYRYEEDDLEYRAGRRMVCFVGVPCACWSH